jgi:acetolactate synthase-1/2/3 large subunit
LTGGGAQDASTEVTLLSEMLQAPVLGYRRGRGVLDSRNPFSVTLPLGRELWGEADVVLAVGTRLLNPMRQWGVDKKLQIVRVDADPDEPARLHKPKVALVGDAAPILRAADRQSRQIQYAPRTARGRNAPASGKVAGAAGQARAPTRLP